jgi:hypothetical protein
MHEPINVKSPNNTSKWQMGFNSAFKGLTHYCTVGAQLYSRHLTNNCVAEIYRPSLLGGNVLRYRHEKNLKFYKMGRPV